MSVSKDTIVKVDLSKLDEYERSLTRIRFGLTTCRDDLSEAGKQLGGILGGLGAAGLVEAEVISDGWATVPIIAYSLGKLLSIPLENWGNKVESNEDWFGDGIDKVR